MLQCVMTIFDKAKRAISNLQERCIQDREEMAAWARAMAVDAEAEVKRRAGKHACLSLYQESTVKSFTTYFGPGLLRSV